jgi:hypothetical protein
MARIGETTRPSFAISADCRALGWCLGARLRRAGGLAGDAVDELDFGGPRLIGLGRFAVPFSSSTSRLVGLDVIELASSTTVAWNQTSILLPGR